MVESLVAAIENLVTAYGAAGVFAGALIEEVFSFIPSAAVIMFAGFFIMGGVVIDQSSLFTFFTSVTLPVSLGLTVGSLFIYGIAYYLGKPAIERFGKYLGVSWSEIELIQNYMKKGFSDDLILFLIRSTPIVPFSAANAFCGLVRWPLKNYVIVTFLGSLIRGSLVGFVGWQLGSLYKGHAELFNQIERAALVIIIAAVVVFIYYRRKRFFNS